MVNISVGYIRLSKDDGSNPSLSPQNQKEIIEAYAKTRGDLINKFFQDINRTGSNIIREDLNNLLNAARQLSFSRLYIKDWSRLARNIVIQETIINELSDLKIEIISCDGIEDKKARQVTGLTNEWLIDECRKKQKQVHELKLQAKIPCCQPPIGYKAMAKTKQWVIDQKNVETVKRIFQLRKEGRSILNIAVELGMPAPSIRYILNNKSYLGFIKYNDRLIPAHEPIISKEDFEICQMVK